MPFVSLRAWIASILAAIILLTAAPAFAHAQLQSTEPAANAVLEAAPDAVRLHFNEPVSALRIELIDAAGTRTDLLPHTQSGTTVVVGLPEAIALGTSVLSWRIVSADGHPVAGSLIFSIGSVTGTAEPVPATDSGVAVALWAGKALLFLALFAGVGGAAFCTLVPLPQEARWTAVVAAVAGLIIAPVTLVLQGLDALGLPPEALLSNDAWRGGFATSYGATVVCVSLAFAVALLAVALPRSPATRTLGAIAFIAGASSLALSGHASAAEPQWLTRPAVFLHLVGILVWIGALPSLWFLLRDRSDDADRALAMFSRYIPYAVGPLLLSGLVLAAIQLGWPGPHWITPYSGILAAKLGLLAVLFALAAWNRLRLTAPALAGNQTARYRLRQSIRAEAIIVVLIAGLVGGWRFTPPPRALSEAGTPVTAEPIYLHLMDANTMVMATVDPGRSGPLDITLVVTDAEGGSIVPEAVTVILSEPSLGIEPFKREAVETAGSWLVDGVVIPVSGTWILEVKLRLSRYSLVKLREAIEIPL